MTNALCKTLIIALTLTTCSALADNADPDKPTAGESALSLATTSMVTVHYTLQNDPADGPAPSWRSWDPWMEDIGDPFAAGPITPPELDLVKPYVDANVTLEAVGVVVAPGQVYTADQRIKPACIKSVEVRTLGGRRLPARLGTLLEKADAIVLTVDDPDRTLTPVDFAEPGEITLRTTIGTVSLTRLESDWCVRTGSMGVSTVRPGAKPWIVFGSLKMAEAPDYSPFDAPTLARRGRDAKILTDKKGRAIGVTCARGIDSTQRFGTWVGRDVLASPRVDLSHLDETKRTLHERLARCVQEVTVEFRDSRPEVFYGVAVSDRRILIPAPLDRKWAARIEHIDVRDDAGRRTPARFIGGYKAFGAFMVELAEGALPASVELADTPPARGVPFWTATPGKKQAHTHLTLDYARLTHTQRGQDNQYHWLTDRPLAGGDLLFDRDGKLFGVFMKQRSEGEESKRLAEGADPYFGDGLDPMRIFTLDELGDALATPGQSFDSGIVVKSRLQADRRPWFGVEYVTLSREIAEQMNVAGPTRDGTIGLLVNAVYEGSPAARAGITEGDILLSIATAGRPIDLIDHEAHGGFEAFAGFWGAGGFNASPAPQPIWKSRANYLTDLLDAIGVGKQATIRYCRLDRTGQPRTRKAHATIELSPPDFHAAARWRNRRLGLSVRDLTYEVRKALGMTPAAAGVVVATVESGSPASVARLFPNEVITHADGSALTSARRFKEIVAAAKRSGKRTVRLTISRLGKNRFADFDVTTYAARDDDLLAEP